MVDEERISPEERLLQSINQGVLKSQDPVPESSAKEAKEKAGGKPPWEKWIGPLTALLPILLERGKSLAGAVGNFKNWQNLSELARKFKPPSKSNPAISWKADLRMVNFILTIAVALFALYWFFDFFFGSLPAASRTPAHIPEPAFTWHGPDQTPLESYTSLAKQRNLFESFVERALHQPAPTTEPEVQQAAATLRLVGVASTEGEFEAIIEDETKKESYFVRKGDRFQNYRVENIDWDRVVLNDGTKRVELQ